MTLRGKYVDDLDPAHMYELEGAINDLENRVENLERSAVRNVNPTANFCCEQKFFNSMDPEWQRVLTPIITRLTVRRLCERLQGTPHLPSGDNIVRAFWRAPDTRCCVILGQDPYPGLDQATGLAFSVPRGAPVPGSLRNILHEAGGAQYTYKQGDEDLSHWDGQGVMLLNTVLTVAPGIPNSHADLGWERIARAALSYLFSLPTPTVFLLMGAKAQQTARAAGVRNVGKKHVISTAHPSPRSAYRGFTGSGCFEQVNKILSTYSKPPICWIPSRG